jgi:hypothetical protein
MDPSNHHEQQIGAYVNSLTPTTDLSLDSSGNSKILPSRLPSAEEASSRLNFFEAPKTYL